jgi:hypothetical protein
MGSQNQWIYHRESPSMSCSYFRRLLGFDSASRKNGDFSWDFMALLHRWSPPQIKTLARRCSCGFASDLLGIRTQQGWEAAANDEWSAAKKAAIFHAISCPKKIKQVIKFESCICRTSNFGPHTHISHIYIIIYIIYIYTYHYIPSPSLQCWSLTSHLSKTMFDLVNS